MNSAASPPPRRIDASEAEEASTVTTRRTEDARRDKTAAYNSWRRGVETVPRSDHGPEVIHAGVIGACSIKLRGEWVDPRLSKVTFEEWTERWWGTTAHLKPYTREGYESLLRVHVLPRFGNVSLGRIQPVDIREWVSHLHSCGLSASRTRQSYYLAAQILRAAVESGYLTKTPCVGVALPRMQRRDMRFLTAEEVRRIAEAMREPYGTLIYTLAYGGLRWGEACGLRRGRCELLRSRLHVAESLSEIRGGFHFGPTKTYQVRAVVLPAFLRDQIAEYLAHRVDSDLDALVFTAPKGGPLRRKEFGAGYWKPALEEAGIEHLRVHDLRHTCASLLIATGANPKAVQAQLATLRYR